MRFGRASGILLHPTSLPGPGEIGTIGRGAWDFVNFLLHAKQSLWQVLPLGPTGYGDSPYQCFSAFAGNPLLIDIGETAPQSEAVDYGALFHTKFPGLKIAGERWRNDASNEDRTRFDLFRETNAIWLDDFAHFMALKNLHGGQPWNRWPREVAFRQPDALKKSRAELADEIFSISWMQFEFFSQWAALKGYANANGIKIIGDIPIFIAHNSADVWARPDLFHLDDNGDPTVIAGVPPDYFSATGQRWGNPHYRWDRMAAEGYAWWIDRFRETLRQVDIIRVDHFRGFEAYWEVPASEETAVNGRWIKGPGIALFKEVGKALGDLPIIAEDLGLITPEVVALREEAGYPGMRILQFGFGSDASDPFLPHNYVPETVAYTGTHDNDTVEGWYASAPENERRAFRKYCGHPERPAHKEMIRLVMESVADTVIIPLQDLLGLGPEARMNFPGRAEGNWTWRAKKEMLSEKIAHELAEITERTGRT